MSEIKVNLKLDAENFNVSIGKIQTRIEKLRDSIFVAASAVVGFQKSFSLVFSAISQAANMQTLQTSFSVLTGSMNKAHETIEKLARFAAVTPFELPELATASQQLLAFGFDADEVVRTLKMVGDVASGSGQPIGDMAFLLGRARVQGQLFTQDINQFTRRGIPVIEELAKVFNVAESEVKGLVETGKVGFPEIMQAFKNMTAEGGRFSGMMEEQSATWNGLLSNLEDAIGAAMRAFGEPIIDGLTPVLKNMVDNADRLSGVAGTIGGAILSDSAGG